MSYSPQYTMQAFLETDPTTTGGSGYPTSGSTDHQLRFTDNTLRRAIKSRYDDGGLETYDTAFKAKSTGAGAGAGGVAGLTMWMKNIAECVSSTTPSDGSQSTRKGGRECMTDNLRTCAAQLDTETAFVSKVGERKDQDGQNLEIKLKLRQVEKVLKNASRSKTARTENRTDRAEKQEESDLGESPTKGSWFQRTWADLSSRAASVSGRTWAGLGAGVVGVSAVAAAAAWYLSSRGTDGTGTGTGMGSAPSYQYSLGSESTQTPRGAWVWKDE